MNVREQINQYLSTQSEEKRNDLEALDDLITGMIPGCRLWYLDGRDDEGRVVSNPNIGYGLQITTYADGKRKEFYQVGMSANTKGISVYIMGLKDRRYLAETYGKSIGKASISGYCIRFKKLSQINREVLQEAMRSGIEQTST